MDPFSRHLPDHSQAPTPGDPADPFGVHAPGRMGALFLTLTRGLGPSWPARRFRIVLRRLSRPWLGECVDTEVYGCRVRLHRTGNICERSALYAPHHFDRRERQVLESFGGPGAVFVDVGANVGLYSLSLARAWSRFEGVRVLSIEPHPCTRARLLFNLDQNRDLPVDVADVAITPISGPVRLEAGRRNLGETRLSRSGDIEVRGTPLLDELGRRGIRRVDALKVDVEGHEDQALVPFLRAAPEDLIPRIAVVEDNSGVWREDLPGWFRRRGLVLSERTRNNLLFTRSSWADR